MFKKSKPNYKLNQTTEINKGQRFLFHDQKRRQLEILGHVIKIYALRKHDLIHLKLKMVILVHMTSYVN